jgi:alpha-galactosidase
MCKIVVIGAGSSMFTKNLVGDLLLYSDIQLKEIALVDINEEKLYVMEKVVARLCKQTGRDVCVRASAVRRDVMAGADFVINVINVGGVPAYLRDLEIPDKYGLHQVVGDIIGPGGMFRFLRAFPELKAICHDMEELCPEAYFFNYTNPMAPLCLALSKETKLKLFGFCHNVQSTALQLAAYLSVPMSRVSYWAAGINHMDWFLEYKVDGKDAYPDLYRVSEDREKIVALQEREPDYIHYDVKLYDLVRFDVMRKYGTFVSESPFHMSEYVPYYRKNKEQIENWLVTDRWWLRHEMAADDYFEFLKGALDSGGEIPLEQSIEYAPRIIHALLTGEPFRANLNVKNTGLIENLPHDSIVEVPCYADSEGIHPCYVGALPEALAALNRTNINVHVLMAKAANEKKLRYIFEAISLDPLTSALLDLDQIRAMTDEMIEANKEYLDGYK